MEFLPVLRGTGGPGYFSRVPSIRSTVCDADGGCRRIVTVPGILGSGCDSVLLLNAEKLELVRYIGWWRLDDAKAVPRSSAQASA